MVFLLEEKKGHQYEGQAYRNTPKIDSFSEFRRSSGRGILLLPSEIGSISS